MKYRKTAARLLSLTLTLSILLQSLPSTAFAFTTSSSKSSGIPAHVWDQLEFGENDLVEEALNNTITGGGSISTGDSLTDYTINAAYKTSGLSLPVFQKASELHGGDNALSRELAALREGVTDDNLDQTEAANIKQLICSGFSYRQARAAIVSAEMLNLSIKELCRAKEAELSLSEATLVEDEVTDDLATRLGIPVSIAQTVLQKEDATAEQLKSSFKTAMVASYGGTVSASKDTVQTASRTASTITSQANYAPEQVLSNPYGYQDYGNLDVNMGTGDYRYTETDLLIPGVNGLDLNFSRIYDSAFAFLETPYGYISGYSEDEYTLRVSYDFYVSYNDTYFTLASNPSAYTIVSEHAALLAAQSWDFKSIDRDAAVECRTNMQLAVNGWIYSGVDAEGQDVGISLHPTIKAIGMFEDAFETFTHRYDYLVDEFGLGHGWRLGFSAIEEYWGGLDIGYIKRLILADGSVYHITDNCTIENSFLDMWLTDESRLIDYTGAAYKLTYADGKREYFDERGRNIAIVDRFGNEITIEYTTVNNGKTVTQIEITDTLGNIVRYKQESLNLGNGEYLYLDGLSSSFNRYNSKWTLSLNDSVIRTYYCYYDGSPVRPHELKVVENELGERTLIKLQQVSGAVNCFLTSPSTNDKKIRYATLDYIQYPNGLRYDFYMQQPSRKTREFLGEMGYIDALHYTGAALREESESGDICRNYTEVEIGDITGFYIMPEEDDEVSYTSTERLRRWVHKQGSEYVGMTAQTTEYNYDYYRTLVEKNVYTHKTVQDKDANTINSYTQTEQLGIHTATSYSYGSYWVPQDITIRTYEPGGTGGYTTATYGYEYDQKGNVTEERLPNGNVITYTYDSTYSLPLTKTYKQDADTVIVEQNTLTSDKKAIAQTTVTTNGTATAKTSYSYDSYGRVTTTSTYHSATDFSTQHFYYGYGKDPQPLQISIFDLKDADGNVTDGHPALGPGAIVERIAYNDRGWPTSYTDGNNNTTTITYDATGRITRVTYPNNTTDRYVYDTAAGTVVYTDPNNNSFTYQYNVFGELTAVIDNATDSELLTYEYDSLGHRVLETVHSSTPGNDKATYHYYDNAGRLIETGIRNADGTDTPLETYVYEANLRKTTQTIKGSGSVPSQINTFYEDALGNTVKTGRYYGNTEHDDLYTYDYLGNVTTYTSAYMASLGSNNGIRYTYDYAGNLLTETAPTGDRKTNVYDWAGNLVSSTEGGATTTYTYDSLGRLIKTTTPIDTTNKSVTKYYYDEAGNVVTQKTSTGTAATNGIPTNYDTVNYTYDSMNRLTAVSYPIDATTTDYTAYTYDPAGNITQMAAGGRKVGTTVTVAPKTTTYTYDRFGNVLTETNGLTAAEIYTYDINGAILASQDRNNILTQYAYDNRSRLIGKTIGSGEDAIAYTYSYALNGALLEEMRNGETFSYTYDSLGRMIFEGDTRFAKIYGYNIGDLRTSFTLYDGETQLLSNTYGYDVVGRLTSVNGNGTYATYVYTDNNLSSVTYPNGTVQNYIYNAGNLVTEVNTWKAGDYLARFQYEYDLAGRQNRKMDMLNPSAIENTFSNDGKGQLICETRSGGSDLPAYTKTYSYDPAGNRATLTEDNSYYGTGETTYTYDAANRLLTSTKNGVTTAYTYDGNGNTLSKQTGNDTVTYTYDAENKLTAISGNGTSVLYEYYPDGLRKSKTVNGITTTYVWDGDNMVYEVTAGNGTTYLYGLDLFAKVEGTTPTYYHYDAHGSVLGYTDNTTWDMWGEEMSLTDAFGVPVLWAEGNDFLYSGEYLDGETGYYYLRARYYDPELGRFTQQDTYPGAIENPNSLNYYIYCYNDPVRYVDRTGNFPVDTFVDAVSLGWSVVDFISTPSRANGVAVLVDIAATFLPYVPGSYGIKGVRFFGSADEASALAKLYSKADNVHDAAAAFRASSKSFVGSYKDIKKTVRALGIKDMEVHHLVEVRFADALGIKKSDINNILSVALDKDTHRKITNDFRLSIGYRYDKNAMATTRNATPQQVWDALIEVYSEKNDMAEYLPMLKQQIIELGGNAHQIDWKGW